MSIECDDTVFEINADPRMHPPVAGDLERAFSIEVHRQRNPASTGSRSTFDVIGLCRMHWTSVAPMARPQRGNADAS
jgi:hypothetical protein